MFSPFAMKYFIICCLVAVVAAAPQIRAPYNPYYNNNAYSPYNAYPNYAQPNYYQPQNQYYRQGGYYPGAYQQPHHPQHYGAPAVADTREYRPDGSYQYSYATADGQQVQAEGYLKQTGPNQQTPSVHGSYSYTSPDGTPVAVSYVADEYGFRAHGPHIANAEAIEKSIALNIESERYQRGPGPLAPIHA